MAAPRIAQLLAGEVQTEEEPKITDTDHLLFEMPPTLTVKEVAEYLRVSPRKLYDMCRIYQGKFFPHFRVGKNFKIPGISLLSGSTMRVWITISRGLLLRI